MDSVAIAAIFTFLGTLAGLVGARLSKKDDKETEERDFVHKLFQDETEKLRGTILQLEQRCAGLSAQIDAATARAHAGEARALFLEQMRAADRRQIAALGAELEGANRQRDDARAALAASERERERLLILLGKQTARGEESESPP